MKMFNKKTHTQSASNAHDGKVEDAEAALFQFGPLPTVLVQQLFAGQTGQERRHFKRHFKTKMFKHFSIRK